MIKETSFIAYQDLKHSGKALSQKLKVFFYIKDNPNVSRTQIAKGLNISGLNGIHFRQNSITGQIVATRSQREIKLNSDLH